MKEKNKIKKTHHTSNLPPPTNLISEWIQNSKQNKKLYIQKSKETKKVKEATTLRAGASPRIILQKTQPLSWLPESQLEVEIDGEDSTVGNVEAAGPVIGQRWEQRREIRRRASI